MGTKIRIIVVMLLYMLLFVAGIILVPDTVSRKPADATLVRTFEASGAVFKSMQLNSWEIDEPFPAKGKVYSVLSLSTHDSGDLKTSYHCINQAYKRIYKGQERNKSVVISGEIKGKLSSDLQNHKLKMMIAASKAQKVEVVENGQVVSVSGYSPGIRELLTLGDKSVNINMAFRYNAVEDKTMVYVGSPIISSEY